MASPLFLDRTALGAVWTWTQDDLIHQVTHTMGAQAIHWYTRNPGTGAWDYRASRFLMGATPAVVAGSIYNEETLRG